MKTPIVIITLALLHISSPMAQVTSEIDSCQIDELGYLEFIYDSKSLSYVIPTDITIDQDLDESDFQLTLSFDNEGKAYNLPHKDDIQPLLIGSHQFTYNLAYEGRLMLNLFNSNGGTPWSTLDSQHLTVSLKIFNTKIHHEQRIVTQPNNSKTVLNR